MQYISYKYYNNYPHIILSPIMVAPINIRSRYNKTVPHVASGTIAPGTKPIWPATWWNKYSEIIKL